MNMDHPQRLMPSFELFPQFGKSTSILKEWTEKLRAIRVKQRLQPLNKQMKEGIRDKGGVFSQKQKAQFWERGRTRTIW